MRIRDSGMPEEEMWTGFFEPKTILTKLCLTAQSGDVVDFGCGYGTFTVVAAQIISGIVHAMDIEPDMVEATRRHAERLGLDNVRSIQRNFVSEGTGLETESVGYAMLFNILHAEDPVHLLREAYRVLAPGGRAGIIHWKYDAGTPRGPAMDIRPRPDQCREWMGRAGLNLTIPFMDLPPYHYGIVGQK